MREHANSGEVPLSVTPRRFDRRYFDRWYRHPTQRVVTRSELRRRVALVLATAEYLLQRPIRSVLDVGCGEAPWRAELRRMRPRLRYVGVDASEYAAARFGRTRNVRHGTIEQLDTLSLAGAYDLVVCADVLHYLPPRAVERGLAHIRSLLAGVAYLPTFTRSDRIAGDVGAVRARDAGWYRARFAAAGLHAVGLECYVPSELARDLSALERTPRSRSRAG